MVYCFAPKKSEPLCGRRGREVSIMPASSAPSVAIIAVLQDLGTNLKTTFGSVQTTLK
jgi:hypothetical protein